LGYWGTANTPIVLLPYIYKDKIENKRCRKECTKLNIPKYTSIDNALSIYYNNSELGNKEIIDLFGKMSPTTLSRLKKAIKNKMYELNIPSFGVNRINTKIAYEMWGIDVNTLKENRKELCELRLLQT